MSAAAGPHFVVGTGRCGSTLLSNILRLHPDVLSLSELFTVLGGPRILRHSELTGAQLEQLLFVLDSDIRAHICAGPLPELIGQSSMDAPLFEPLRLAPLPHLVHDVDAMSESIRTIVRQLPRAPLCEQLARVFDHLGAQLGRGVWVERSGGSIEYIDLLRHHWPQAKYVLLLRDGPQTALSMSRHLAFRVRVARIEARDPTLPVGESLTRPLALARFGAYWSALLIKATRSVREMGHERTLILRYERLLADPEAVLQQVWRFLDVPLPGADIVDAMRVQVRPQQRSLDCVPDTDRIALERSCRPGMRALDALCGQRTVAVPS